METLVLNSKEIVLVKARGVKNGRVQLTFAQIVDTGRSTSLAGMLNASDDRFNQQKPQFAWQTGLPEDIKATFGIDVSTLAEGEELEIMQVNPMATDKYGTQHTLNIQISETTTPDEYQRENVAKTAKRTKADGPFIYHNGQHIFRKAEVVAGKPNHFFFPASETTRSEEVLAAAAVNSALDNE
jgi:hypothetical protein